MTTGSASCGSLPMGSRPRRYAIGGSEFIERTERQLQERRSGRIQDADLALPRLTVGIEQIDRLVASQCGVEPADLKTHGHRTSPASEPFLAESTTSWLASQNRLSLAKRLPLFGVERAGAGSRY